jgi:cobalt/nickel transport system ATP-binding protein
MEFDQLMEFERVAYTYPCTQLPAVQNLALNIPSNSCCALIGRNGCGKTTLFRLANGLYHPTQGRIRWQGQPLRYDHRSLNQLRQQVGLVFQDPEKQLVGGTVEEDLSYGLCNLGLPDREVRRRVQAALEAFDLADLADTPVNYLSLGQKKRLSIADVMVLEPQLLLLDEPTAYLDPAQTRNLLNILDSIGRTGVTILIATHDLEFVDAWADWVLVMDQGQLILEDTPENVFKQRQRLEDLGLGVPISAYLLDVLGRGGQEAIAQLPLADAPMQIRKLQQRLQQQL